MSEMCVKSILSSFMNMGSSLLSAFLSSSMKFTSFALSFSSDMSNDDIEGSGCVQHLRTDNRAAMREHVKIIV